jgi:hypothetical protein
MHMFIYIHAHAQELIRRKIEKLERLVQCKDFVAHMEMFTSRLQVGGDDQPTQNRINVCLCVCVRACAFKRARYLQLVVCDWECVHPRAETLMRVFICVSG